MINARCTVRDDQRSWPLRSQQLSREAWQHNDRIMSPSTNTKLWFRGRILNFRTIARVFGLPDSFVLPELPDSAIRTLLGNAICAPMVGGVFLAVLSTVKL